LTFDFPKGTDDLAATTFGTIGSQIEALGTPIGVYDLQYKLPPSPLTNNLTLITHNTREFQRINNLFDLGLGDIAA
jgi:tRNA(fMet)-specific endonuclease VapC